MSTEVTVNREARVKLRLLKRPAKADASVPQLVVGETVAPAQQVETPAVTQVGDVDRVLEMNGNREMPVLMDKEQAKDVATQLQSICRGFRLSFGTVGEQRSYSENDKRGMLSSRVDADTEQISVARRLFGKHQAMTAFSSAKNAVKEMFDSLTLPYPERSVRILRLDTTDWDLDNWSEEQIAEAVAAQVARFEERMAGVLGEYEIKLQELCAAWDEVLDVARDKLRTQFDRSDYPAASEVAGRYWCRFEPFNVSLSPEYHTSSIPGMKKAVAQMQARFEAAAQMQAAAVVAELSSSLEQMLDSVRGWANKDQRSFKNSVLENVINACSEFKNRTVKFGILKGSAFEDIFNKVSTVLGTGGAEAIGDLIRNVPRQRQQMMNTLQEVQSELKQQVDRYRNRRAISLR